MFSVGGLFVCSNYEQIDIWWIFFFNQVVFDDVRGFLIATQAEKSLWFVK